MAVAGVPVACGDAVRGDGDRQPLVARRLPRRGGRARGRGVRARSVRARPARSVGVGLAATCERAALVVKPHPIICRR